MTSLEVTPGQTSLRRTSARSYLMCPPTYFEVRYEINPWMAAGVPVDLDLASAQWGQLVAA